MLRSISMKKKWNYTLNYTLSHVIKTYLSETAKTIHNQ